MLAVLQGDVATVKSLLDNGADINEKDAYGKTALMKAVEKGDIDTVKTLLDRGADTNIKTDRGGTALLAAAYGGHTAVIQALLEKGAEVNAKDMFGTTALMVAARYGHRETVTVLLDKGADVTIKNKGGATALMLAAEEKNAEVAELLEDAINRSSVISAPAKGEAKDTAPPVIEITRVGSATRGLGGITGTSPHPSPETYHTTIEGIARDESRIAWVTINDKQARLSSGGEFRLEVNLKPGDNHFLVAAMDVEKNIGRKEIVLKGDKNISLVPPQDTFEFSGNYYALIIGNNNYRNLPKLRTARHDAKEVKRVLEQKYGFKTRLLLDATRADMLHALNYFRKTLKEEDHFLLYYAGHGEFDTVAQKAYWLPVDALRDDDTNWIIVDIVTANIKRIAAKHVLVVADSCYSGTFTRKAITDLGPTPEKERYLKKMYRKSSRTLMASGGNEPVSDIGGGNHSVFASAFIQGLEDMKERIFTAEEFYFEQIKERVAGNAQQTPEYNPIRKSGHDGGDFIFRRQVMGEDPPQP
jgi:hypothetical protein